MKILESLKFDEAGLVAAVVQDAASGEVLMVAYMNREAVARTIETGLAHFWSRSRGKLWLKGESSGHTQAVREVRLDCDGDALLLRVEQKGGACHTGYRSCFYRRVLPRGEGAETSGEKVFDPGTVYG
ncbi:MAG: phosphoribosyl-AMP cyclohydrolase [bacterium]|nr:phosphoribosyl-AMP cyclohydrolase [bacterium]